MVKQSELFISTVSARREQDAVLKRPPRRWLKIRWDLLSIPVVLAAGVLLWGWLVEWRGYPAFILPGPIQVWNKAVTMAMNGMLWKHAQVTLIEIGLGLLIGLSLALLLGYLLGKSRTLDRLLSPYIVASQTIPIVAVAPLLVIWFGSGLTSKVLICALIVFFPTLVSTMVGIRNVDPDLHDLMRSLRANRMQIFTKLELPAALPVLFGGLKLSVILSVVGAVVGEFVGADVGLGFLVNLGRGVLDTPMIFVAVLSLVIIAQILYLIVSLIEAYFLRWQR
jgi:NitT/TauT family transport system permease protein